MTAPISAAAAIVDKDGRATRAFIGYLQSLGTGQVQRTVYTFAQIERMMPTAGLTVFCSDSSATTFRAVLAGGGSALVPAFGDGADWRVG